MKDKDIILKKYDYIDSIRGFAILGVVLVHSSQWIAPTSSILSLIAVQGARGVQLFYIASALTLFLSMASRKEQQEEMRVLSFFNRRFFRIAPAFYLAIISYTLYDGFSPPLLGTKWHSMVVYSLEFSLSSWMASRNNYISCAGKLVNSC